MKPDASKHNQRPEYIRGLVTASGLSINQAAKAIGISPRAMRYYTSTDPAEIRKAPYVVQFALECLALTTKESP